MVETVYHVALKLIPFFATTTLYFVLFIPQDQPSICAMIVKCLPILSLKLFIVLHGVGMSKEHTYARKIFVSMLFSVIGDACLIWPNYFAHGMIAFAVAQVFNISAFGFKPLKLHIGLGLYLLAGSALIILLPVIQDPVLLYGIPFYSILLSTMAWRATVRLHTSQSPWTWPKLLGAIGGWSFVASDAVLAFSTFYTHIPNAQLMVLSTYFTAQFGITMSLLGEDKPLSYAKTERTRGGRKHKSSKTN